MDIMKDAIQAKYSLIRYYYTELFLQSRNGGAGVYRPLFFDYPNDMEAYKNVTHNVMIGDSLKLSILSDAVGQNYTEFYFPAGTWCNVINDIEPCFTSKGEWKELRTKAYDYYLHIKEGSIVPLQNGKEIKPITVSQMQDEKVNLHILPKPTTIPSTAWTASGKYVNDDGITLDLEGNYNEYKISAAANKEQTRITIQFETKHAYNHFVSGSNCTAINENDFLDYIVIHNAKALGLDKTIFGTAVLFNDQHISHTGKYVA